MSEHVIRNSKTKQLAVLSVPEGAEDQIPERVAAVGAGWALDKKTDPADVPSAVEAPTVSAQTKES